jgi:serine/threonine protein kinase
MEWALLAGKCIHSMNYLTVEVFNFISLFDFLFEYRLAPEVIKHARSSQFSDVYSYGIILWELATREEVYQGLETTQIIAKVANENLRPPVPMDCPWKDIMVTCWAENPLDRLEFSEIVEAFTDLKKKFDGTHASENPRIMAAKGDPTMEGGKST